MVVPGTSNSRVSGITCALKNYFATFVVPDNLGTDGGPLCAVKETDNFFHKWGAKAQKIIIIQS